MAGDLRPPSRAVCLKLLRQYQVPEHVIQHSLQVERVASFLGELLNAGGAGLDLRLIEAAALLHDITKIDGLQTGKDHAQTGGELIRRLGYDRVAEVVENHVMVRKRGKPGGITEDELVNYADKRVMHREIVTLEERMEDLQRRYGRSPRSQTLIQRAIKSIREIEERIFGNLTLRPDELASAIEEKRVARPR